MRGSDSRYFRGPFDHLPPPPEPHKIFGRGVTRNKLQKIEVVFSNISPLALSHRGKLSVTTVSRRGPFRTGTDSEKFSSPGPGRGVHRSPKVIVFSSKKGGCENNPTPSGRIRGENACNNEISASLKQMFFARGQKNIL